MDFFVLGLGGIVVFLMARGEEEDMHVDGSEAGFRRQVVGFSMVLSTNRNR